MLQSPDPICNAYLYICMSCFKFGPYRINHLIWSAQSPTTLDLCSNLYPERTWQPIWLWKTWKRRAGLTDLHVQQTKQGIFPHISSVLVTSIVIVHVFLNPWLCFALELPMRLEVNYNDGYVVLAPLLESQLRQVFGSCLSCLIRRITTYLGRWWRLCILLVP